MMDLKNIKTQRKDLLFRGAMGTTGSKSNTSLSGASVASSLQAILCSRNLDPFKTI
jgi:hypothetical protein